MSVIHPAGSVGMMGPTNIIGKAIALHELAPFSHTVVSLGNGSIVDSTSPWTRLTAEQYWENHKYEWYRPIVPFTPEETRILKSVSYMIEGRIAYAYKNLLDFLVKGAPQSRGHFLFCSYLVAELYMVVRDLDISGKEQPWTVGIEELLKFLRTSGHFERI